eukprot:scaffold74345_cov37-Tisochrysis_lutea.AAC.1
MRGDESKGVGARCAGACGAECAHGRRRVGCLGVELCSILKLGAGAEERPRIEPLLGLLDERARLVLLRHGESLSAAPNDRRADAERNEVREPTGKKEGRRGRGRRKGPARRRAAQGSAQAADLFYFSPFP